MMKGSSENCYEKMRDGAMDGVIAMFAIWVFASCLRVHADGYFQAQKQNLDHLGDQSMVSSGFFLICMLHSLVALSCGAMMMFYRDEVFVFSHGKEHATKLLGSTPHDQLLIRTSDSFSGLLLFGVGFLLLMVAFVKEKEFHGFFARGCVLLHVAMAIWRIYFERKVEDLGHDWLLGT